MSFRVAGADDVEFRRFFFDEGHEVAGVFEGMSPFTAWYFVAAQGQDIFDFGSDFYGEISSFAAGTAGDADEIGMKFAQFC